MEQADFAAWSDGVGPRSMRVETRRGRKKKRRRSGDCGGVAFWVGSEVVFLLDERTQRTLGRNAADQRRLLQLGRLPGRVVGSSRNRSLLNFVLHQLDISRVFVLEGLDRWKAPRRVIIRHQTLFVESAPVVRVQRWNRVVIAAIASAVGPGFLTFKRAVMMARVDAADARAVTVATPGASARALATVSSST